MSNSMMDSALCDGDYHNSVKRVRTVSSFGSKVSKIRDLLSKILNFNPGNNPACLIEAVDELTAEKVKMLLRVIYEDANRALEFMPCSDGCDDVCIADGGRIFLFRECPDCGKRLIRIDNFPGLPLNTGIMYSCPTDPLTHYQFVFGKLQRAS